MAAHTLKPAPFVAFCLLYVSTVFGQGSIPSVQLTVPLATQSPVIDGKVTAEEQSRAVSASLVQVGGLDKKVLYPTQLFISTTVSGFYVGFIAEEPALDTLVNNAVRENGAVFNDDSLQIFLTPTMDTAADAYYHFAINSNGLKYSTHLLSGEVVTGWQSAVSKGEKNWQAEIFIPLTSINAPAELPMWRANFARVRPARGGQPEEISAWVNPGASLHNYKKFGYLTVPRFIPPAPSSPFASSAETTRSAGILTTTTLRSTPQVSPSTFPSTETGASQ